MFSWLYKRNNHLQDAITKIEKEHKHALHQLDELQVLVKQEQEALAEIKKNTVAARLQALVKHPCVINWKLMKAFSIERSYDDNAHLITIIGYFAPDGSLGQWHLYTSEDTHAALLKEFIAYRDTNETV